MVDQAVESEKQIQNRILPYRPARPVELNSPNGTFLKSKFGLEFVRRCDSSLLVKSQKRVLV
jgi:hypothetical protein